MPPMLGWVCAYTPEEVFAALGLESRRLFGERGGAGREVDLEYLPSNFCPLSRACLQEVLGKQGHSLNGVVLPASCHAMVHLANALEYAGRRRGSGLKVHRLELPRTRGGSNPAAVEAFATSMRQLAGELGRTYGVTWDEAALHRAVELNQGVRLRLRKLDLLRRAHPEGFRAAGFLKVVQAATASGREEFIRRLDGMLEALQGGHPGEDPGVARLVATLRRHGDRGGPRLLVTGSPLAPACLDVIEELGGNIAGDDFCQGYRSCLPQVEDQGDPWLSLARGYLERFPCPRMLAGRERGNLLLSRVRECRAQGVIYHALKFCDASLYEFPFFRELCEGAGVPVLYLETEYRGAGLEQARTRIQAFLELLAEQGGD